MKKIISAAERYMKIDLTDMISGGFWLSIGKISSILILLVLSMIYARYLTKDIYGEFRYIMSIMGMFSILTFPGLATSTMRSIARGYEGTYRKAARHMFYISFSMTAIGLGFGIFYYVVRPEISLAYGFFVAALFVPLTEGLGSWRAYLDGKKEFKEKTIRNICNQFFYGILMVSAIIFIVYAHPSLSIGLALLVSASYLGHGIPNMLYSLELLKKIPRSAPEESESLRYGYHLTLLDIIPNIAYNIDTILLFNVLGPSALAVYSFAVAPIEQIRTLFDTFLLTIFPKIALKTENVEKTSALRKILRSKVIRAIPLTAIVALAYILLAPTLFRLLFPAYMESVLPSQILAISLLFFPLNISNTALKAEGNIKKLFIVSTVSPIGKIAAFIIFIPLYGLWGAVSVRVAGIVFQYILAFFLFQKK